jgi:hypothetical protein|tara:strand:- start:427 stop:837 length:411 start_codon:yes stop_codon:yes gene_type:complete
MKKDWDTIAAIEKAIAQKYGKLSVQDFRSDWAPEKEEEYLKQIKSRRSHHQNKDSASETIIKGDVVINKRNKKQKADRTCPVCKTYSFSRRDDLYMNRFDCCERCYIVFVVNREEKWRDGWRPDDDQVKISLRRKK